jgi:AcrR family transcriptional regulator
MRPTGRKLPSGRHGLSRSFVVTDQRERILAAVADGVAEKGYAALTVEEVVRLAGVSRRTFYDQFKDKRDAFFAAYDASVQQCMLSVAVGFASSTHWPEQVRLGLQAFLRYLTEDPAFTRMGIVEIPLAGPEGQARHFAARAGFEVFLAPGAARAGHPIPPMVPRTVGAGLFAMAYARVVRGRVKDLPGLLPAMTYHCLSPYLGTEIARGEADAARRMIAAPGRTIAAL